MDNLKLGYGGTKEEMERLLANAEKIEALNGRTVKYSINSLADIIDAIHVVQRETGISGATAEEGAKTIDGSLKSLKAAWKNLVTGLANPDADLGKLIGDVVKTAKTALVNLVPAVKQALKGVATLIKEAAPIIAEELPGLIDDILPDLLDAAGTLIAALVENLPSIIGTLLTGILREFPKIFATILGAFDEMSNTFGGNVATFIIGLMATIKGIGIVKSIHGVITAIGGIAQAGLNLANQVVPGLSASFAKLVTSGDGLAGVLANVGTVAWGLTDALLVMYDVQKLNEAANTYNEAQQTHEDEAESALENYRQLYETKGKEVADQWAAMVYQIDTTSLSLEEAQGQIAKTIEGYWDGVPQNMWDGFKQGWDHYFGQDGEGLFSLLGDAFTDAVGGVMGILGINSPSTVFYDMADNTVQGYHNGLVDGAGKIDSGFEIVKDRIRAFMDSTSSFVDGMKNIGTNLISAIGNGFVSGASAVFNQIREVGVNIIKAAKNVFGIASPSKVFAGIGQFIDEGLAQGVVGNMGVVERAMDRMNGIVSDGGYAVQSSFVGGSTQPNMASSNSRMEQLMITAIDTMKQARPINIDGKYLVAVLAPYIDAKLGEMMNYRQREAAYL